eukprot:GHVL01018415.1.p1 GENE.GHVL01018415.1~~GHVL01018415.1.p1  ORF type:complete len:215 (+),score=26.89 GHVL01018415.1:379-1023(+)
MLTSRTAISPMGCLIHPNEESSPPFLANRSGDHVPKSCLGINLVPLSESSTVPHKKNVKQPTHPLKRTGLGGKDQRLVDSLQVCLIPTKNGSETWKPMLKTDLNRFSDHVRFGDQGLVGDDFNSLTNRGRKHYGDIRLKSYLTGGPGGLTTESVRAINLKGKKTSDKKSASQILCSLGTMHGSGTTKNIRSGRRGKESATISGVKQCFQHNDAC